MNGVQFAKRLIISMVNLITHFDCFCLNCALQKSTGARCWSIIIQKVTVLYPMLLLRPMLTISGPIQIGKTTVKVKIVQGLFK